MGTRCLGSGRLPSALQLAARDTDLVPPLTGNRGRQLSSHPDRLLTAPSETLTPRKEASSERQTRRATWDFFAPTCSGEVARAQGQLRPRRVRRPVTAVRKWGGGVLQNTFEEPPAFQRGSGQRIG